MNYHTCENVLAGGTRFPGSCCADKINGKSCSCFAGFPDGAGAEFAHDSNMQSCGVPESIDNADHAPTRAINFENSATCVLHPGHTVKEICGDATCCLLDPAPASAIVATKKPTFTLRSCVRSPYPLGHSAVNVRLFEPRSQDAGGLEFLGLSVTHVVQSKSRLLSRSTLPLWAVRHVERLKLTTDFWVIMAAFEKTKMTPLTLRPSSVAFSVLRARSPVLLLYFVKKAG